MNYFQMNVVYICYKYLCTYFDRLILDLAFSSTFSRDLIFSEMRIFIFIGFAIRFMINFKYLTFALLFVKHNVSIIS